MDNDKTMQKSTGDETEVSNDESSDSVLNTEQKNSLSMDEVKKMFDLLKQGRYIVRLDKKKVVLVLGVTGSGKTTLVQLLTKDNCQLFCKEFGIHGEFIIEDSDGKIKAGIVSKTIFPEIFLDSETNVMFCDTPGFDDTRGTAVDIVAMYFLKEIVENAEEVKILLTINHSSLRVGIDRKDFINLIRHTVTLLKNIKKFENSIALVATKVENSYKKIKNELVLVSDESIIEYISEFLRTAKRDLTEVVEGELLQEAKYLIDVLLMNTGIDDYKRIGLIRRPEEVGLLSEMKLLQNEKIRIKNIVGENLTYTNVKETDFGYSISEKSKNDIPVIIEFINNKIVNQVRMIGLIIEGCYRMKESQSNDVYKLRSEYSSKLEKIRKIIESMNKDLNLEEFVKILMQFVDELNFSYKTFKILQQNKYLKFLEIVNERKFENLSLIWKNGLSEINKYITISELWYKFLVNVYEKLSSYGIQKRKRDFTYINNGNICRLNDESVERFMNDIDLLNDYKKVKDLMIDEIKLYKLNEIIKSTLIPHQPIHNYDWVVNSCVIKGDYVILSSISINRCPKKMKFFVISATQKIFIDTNLINSEFDLQQVTFVSPVIEIIEKPKIILLHQNNLPSNNESINSDKLINLTGILNVVGDHFVNWQNLNIFANTILLDNIFGTTSVV
ncbi:hypothetical protein PGB90_009253 [Kerria lacca]